MSKPSLDYHTGDSELNITAGDVQALNSRLFDQPETVFPNKEITVEQDLENVLRYITEAITEDDIDTVRKTLRRASSILIPIVSGKRPVKRDLNN